jgi:hypothetical protein
LDVPQFPIDESGLAEWSVYADHLQELGDPRGALIALELVLPARIERAALQPFHARFRRLCRNSRAIEIGWCLGHARDLAIHAIPQGLDEIAPGHPALAHARTILQSPISARLESLELPFSPAWLDLRIEWRSWTRLMAALPPSCSRVTISVPPVDERVAGELIASLPSTVRAICLQPFGVELSPGDTILTFLDDRFDLVEVGPISPNRAQRVAEKLRSTTHLRLRSSKLIGPALGTRIELGGPGAAALVEAENAYAFSRHSLLQLQRRYGGIPIRAQLARELPECASLATATGGIDLARRGVDYTLRGVFQEVAVNGRTLENEIEIVPISDGDHITIGGLPFTFFTTDVSRRASEILARRS